MATTPGSRRRTDLSGDDRDPLNPMQEPLGSMDRPGRTSDLNEVNLAPGETVRRTGNLGTTNDPRGSATERSGRSFTATFAIAAVVLLVAFLIALYVGNNRSNVATGIGPTEAPVADSNTGTSGDTTGSTTPAPQTTPGTGDASSTTGGTTGTTAPPANP